MLARLKPKPGETQKAWLLFKERDAAADTGRRHPGGAAREREDRAADRGAGGAARPAAEAARGSGPGRCPGAVRAPMPGPARAAARDAGRRRRRTARTGCTRSSSTAIAPWRTSADGAARLITRSGLDWTHRYGDLGAAFAALPCREAVIDGEIVVLDARGVSRFAALQDALSRGAGNELVFYAFDLLHLDGWDLTRGAARAAQGAAAAAPGRRRTGRSAIQFSDHVAAAGGAFYDRVSRARARGHRLQARLGAVPARALEDLDQGQGAADRRFRHRRLYRVGGRRRPRRAGAGASGTRASCTTAARSAPGSTPPRCGRCCDRLEPLRDDGAAPRGGAEGHRLGAAGADARGSAMPTAPRDGALRHAVFKGLREVELSRREGRAPRKRLISEADLATVTITNPTRRLFGRCGPTKLDIAVYYAAIGDFMLPHILGRPVSLVRCPTGQAERLLLPAPCLQRHAGVAWRSSRPRPRTARPRPTSASRTPRATWRWRSSGWSSSTPGARWPDVSRRPDRVVFDLDPGEGIAWREVVEAAVHVRGELGGARARAVRQDLRRQGPARGGADHARSSTGRRCTPATGEIAANDRRDGAGHLHHHHGQGEPQAADLHRLSPQRPQRDGGGALFAARAQQPAGIGAA